jgi:predicted SAM-dependent methyltransferase
MTPIQLHIGGKQAHPDWKILDIEPRPEVDIVGDAAQLGQLAELQGVPIGAIYASHVLEHFYYGLNNELLTTLTDWYKALQPGGKILISVPNLKVLCWLYLNPNLVPDERFQLMRIMFGGQTNAYDVHKVGFDEDILASYLQEVGFIDCEVISEFGLFDDCSGMRLGDQLISLNMVATKPEPLETPKG